MNYVLLTHVPTYAGQSAGVVRLTEPFRDDLLAEAAALRQAGFRVTLATPRHATPDARSLARERYADVRLAEHGIADAPLPAYRTMPQFMAAGVGLKDEIIEAVRDADVVQLGAGGHPMALGEFAWPLVEGSTAKRVFVFAEDPLPARQKHVTSGRNPAKRLGKLLAVRRFGAFCRQAVRDATLVFAHDAAVQRRFGREWNAHCHAFALAPLGDADLADVAVTGARAGRVADAARPVRWVAVGSDAPTAGLDHLLRAIAKAGRLGARVSLALHAPAKPTSALQKMIDATDGRAVWERSPLTAAAMDAADGFVAAPLAAGENRTIFAASGRGLPIVTYQGGLAEAGVAAAGGGVVVPRGETDLLAQTLLDLARDRQRLIAMAAAARQWAAGVTRDAVHRRRAGLVRAAVAA